MYGMSESHEEEPLGFLMYRVMAALRPQVAAEFKPLRLSLPEFVCLRILSKDPGLTSAELARRTNVTAKAATQVLPALEEPAARTRPAPAPAGRAMPAQLPRRGKVLLKRADPAV